MKKYNLTKFMYGIFLMLLSIPFFTSCVDENDTELPFLEVSSNTLAFDVNGNPLEDGLNYFEISTNRPWRITIPEDKNWVTLSSTVGDGPAKITVSVPENINDKAEIKVEIINKIGVILNETISIISGDITPAIVIYCENFGPNGDKVNDRWQYVDQYKEWAKTGEGASNVTYDGSSASIRNSGKLSAGYDGASGNAKLFFSSDAYFVVNNITLKENQTNLNLSFGGSYSLRKDDGTYDNEFKLDKFTVKLSADGKTWSDNLALTMKKGDEYWNLLSSDFTLPNPISSLYIKFISGEASVFSIDDVKLTTGKGGNIINLEGSGENPEEPSEAKAITIPEINAMMTAEGAVVDASADRYFEAVVQNDTLGKNFSAINLFVATENSKDASNGITLYGSQVNIYTLNLNKGDKVKVTLKKGLAKAQNYNGMYELTGDKEADWVLVEKLQGKATITPVVITPDKLSSYQGMTVSIESATPAKAGSWEGGKTQTFNASGKDFNAYCNKSAVFVDSKYSVKTGTITGIPSVYKNSAQILPRDAEDVKAFSGEGGEEGAKAITIPEINAMMTAEGAVVDASADRYFEAVVQNDTLGKNFSAVNLFVATENSKDASNGITLYGSQVNIYTLNLNKGDKVKVTLKKGLAKAQNYNGMYELTGDKEADWVSVEKLQGKATITPVVITPDKLSSYQGMTVSIESATPAKAGTWEGGKTQTFNASGKDFNAYCNKSAVFVDSKYSVKTGTITGIPSVYKNSAQILPRDAEDVKAFSGEGGEEGAKAITIPEINAMMTAEGAVVDASADRYFEAVVQNDTLGKNFSAVNLFVATENSKDASNGITLYGSQVNIYTLNLNKGDKVKVTLKKGLAKAQNYNGMYELTGDKDADWVLVEKLQGKATITPVVITPDKLSSYQGMTVSIESATPAKAGTWEGGKTQTFNASGKDFNVYCNKSAVFAGEQYVEATGIISGIVTVYKNNAQMLPRDAVDVKAFSGTTPPPSSGNEIALTKDNIVSGKTGSVELISNGYGKQDVADESTWYTFKNGDYNFTGARIGLGPDKNGGGIQVQGNASDVKKQGFIHNVSEIKEIQSIEIVLKVAKTSDYDPSYSVYVGDKVNPNSENTTLTASIEKTEEGDFRVYKDTYDVSSKGKFNFLSIKNDKAGVLYIQTITIKYKGE